MIPSQIYMIPNYLLVRDLGWLDTLSRGDLAGRAQCLWLILAAPVLFHFSARAGGSGNCRRRGPAYESTGRYLIPVNRNALIALGIFVFLHSWNDLFWPLIVLSRVGKPNAAGGLGGAWRGLMAPAIRSLNPP